MAGIIGFDVTSSMRVVATFVSSEDAHIAKGRLASFNIDASIRETSSFPSLIGVSLAVDVLDWRTAIRILRETPNMIGVISDVDYHEDNDDKAAALPHIANEIQSTSVSARFPRSALWTLLLIGTAPWILASVPTCLGYFSLFSGSKLVLVSSFTADIAWFILIVLFVRRYKLSLRSFGIDGRKTQLAHVLVCWLILGTISSYFFAWLYRLAAVRYGVDSLNMPFQSWDQLPFAYEASAHLLNIVWTATTIIVTVRLTQLIGWPKLLSALLSVGLVGLSGTPAWTIYISVLVLLLSLYYSVFNCGTAIYLTLVVDWLYQNHQRFQ